MLSICGHDIDPPLILAPMMDITGKAFRDLVRDYGGCGLFYSEMLNSRYVPREKDDSPIFKGFAGEKNLVLQLLGRDPVYLRESVKRLESFHPFGFDLNMGCCRAAILRHGWGAALLTDITAAAKAIAAIRKATRKPITVKIRNAWKDKIKARTFLKMFETEGINAIIVHARTPEKIFARPAKWEWIGEVKSILNVPVIGNGDIVTAADALEMFKQTGCDGVMIGRAAVAHPTIFREILALSKEYDPAPRPKTSTVFEKFIEYLGEELETPKRTAELRTFCKYFARGLPVPHWFWGPIQGQKEPKAVISTIRAYFQRNGM